jgi:acetate kinase
MRRHILQASFFRRCFSNVLVLNCGSSSIKYQVINPIEKKILMRGGVDRLQESIYHDSLQKIIETVNQSGISVSAIGHRWVNGGAAFRQPVIASHEIITQLQGILTLAP